MFNLPGTCIVDRIIPKDKFKEKEVLFTSDVERIRWKYLINDKTTNLFQNNPTDAIVVVSLKFKNDNNMNDIIKIIDKSMEYNILFEVEYNKTIQYAFYDKQFFKSKFDDYFKFDLIANDVLSLYDKIKKQIINQEAISDKAIEDIIEEEIRIKNLEKEIKRLKKLKKQEKQINKKNEIRKKIKELERL